MKKIETYGLNVDLESLEKAASETRTWPTKRMWDVLFYDTRDGKVWLSPESEDSWSELATEFCGLCQSSVTCPLSPSWMPLSGAWISKERKDF